MEWYSNVPLKNVIHRVFYLNHDKQCLGTKINDAFEYESYGECFTKSLQLCSFLQHIPSRSTVGICTINSPNFMITDIACVLSDFISTGIHLDWDEEIIKNIISQTNMKCLIIHSSQIEKFSQILTKIQTTIEQIIIIDTNGNENIEFHKNIKINTWEDILSCKIHENYILWTKEPHAFLFDEENSKETCSILFTSGSTGSPKGVQINKKRWKRDFLCSPFVGCNLPLTILNHMSLAHGADRVLCWQMLHSGGRIAFSNPKNHKEIMENIQLSKPGFFLAMSHFWSRCYSDFINELSKRTINTLFSFCTSEKIECNVNKLEFECFLQNSNDLLNKLSNLLEIRDDLIEEVREKWFGGNIFTPVTGGSHTSETVIEWMKEIFSPKTSSGEGQGTRVQNAYGATEFTGISVNGEINENIELILIDVPEMSK